MAESARTCSPVRGVDYKRYVRIGPGLCGLSHAPISKTPRAASHTPQRHQKCLYLLRSLPVERVPTLAVIEEPVTLAFIDAEFEEGESVCNLCAIAPPVHTPPKGYM